MEDKKRKKRLLALKVISVILESIAVVLACYFINIAFFLIPSLVLLLTNIYTLVLEQRENKIIAKNNEKMAKKPTLTKQQLFRDIHYAPFRQGLELYDRKNYTDAISAFNESLAQHRKKNRIKSVFIVDHIAPAINYNIAETYVKMAKSTSCPIIKDGYYSKANSNYMLAKNGFWPIENENVKIGKHIDSICSGICVAIAELYNLQGNKEKYIEYEEMAIRSLEQSAGRYASALISGAKNAVTYEDYQRALTYWNKLLKLYEDIDIDANSELILTWKQLLDAYIGLANCHYYLGEYVDALSIYKRNVCHICEQHYGTEHPNTAAVYHDIASTYFNKGDYSEALEWYQKGLEIFEKMLGLEQPTAATYNDIASVYSCQGDYPKALQWYQKALAIRERILGFEHPDVSTTATNIANVYSCLGDNPKALEWYQKALIINEKMLGLEHPNTASTYNNMASVYFNQGDYFEALEWCQKALAIREKILGLDHPVTATTYANIAVAYSHLGDNPKALEWDLKALTINEKMLGLEHPNIATNYNNIACAYSRQGDYPKALEWYKKALAIREKKLGKEHLDTATTYNNIAGVYENQDDYSKALEWYQKALPIYVTVLGAAHPYAIDIENKISSLCNCNTFALTIKPITKKFLRELPIISQLE